jgi:hypothetical protein
MARYTMSATASTYNRETGEWKIEHEVLVIVRRDRSGAIEAGLDKMESMHPGFHSYECEIMGEYHG